LDMAEGDNAKLGLVSVFHLPDYADTIDEVDEIVRRPN